MLSKYNFGKEFKRHRAGYLAIIGRPNAGKSSLFNALLKHKLSIVSLKSNTTRHCITGILSEKHHQILVLDTPGIIIGRSDSMGRHLMKTLGKIVSEADCLIAVIDASESPSEAFAMLQLDTFAKLPPLSLVMNKMDLVSSDHRNMLLEYFKKKHRFQQIFESSSLMNYGLENIKSWAISCLPISKGFYPKKYVANQPERFFISELIREKIFELYHKEVPYSCHVVITDYREKQRPLRYLLRVDIWVEKINQKKILLGKEGVKIKQLSKSSCKAVEDFLKGKVNLFLHVKVVEKLSDHKN
jgi:GTP-binding protein Era